MVTLHCVFADSNGSVVVSWFPIPSVFANETAEELRSEGAEVEIIEQEPCIAKKS